MLMLLSFNCRKMAPTILLDVPQDSAIMNEEIFGPLLPIVTVGTKRVDYIEIWLKLRCFFKMHFYRNIQTYELNLNNFIFFSSSWTRVIELTLGTLVTNRSFNIKI